jgi:hypothetical protein
MRGQDMKVPMSAVPLGTTWPDRIGGLPKWPVAAALATLRPLQRRPKSFVEHVNALSELFVVFTERLGRTRRNQLARDWPRGPIVPRPKVVSLCMRSRPSAMACSISAMCQLTTLRELCLRARPIFEDNAPAFTFGQFGCDDACNYVRAAATCQQPTSGP